MNTALNVPLFLLAWYAQGRQFLGKTILTSLLFSVMLYIASKFPMYHGDLLTAAAYGGVLMGAGLGLVLRGGATIFGYGKLSGKRTKCAVLCFFAKRPFSGQKSYHEY